MIRFDYRISDLCKKDDIAYTRYADDLTLSGESNVIKKIGIVIAVLDSEGLKLNYRKTNIQRKGRQQKVCGLVVNDIVSIGRDRQREIRAAIPRTSDRMSKLHLEDALERINKILDPQ